MPRRKSRPAILIGFAATLLACARVLAATPDGWFGLSLNVEIESVDRVVQTVTVREVLPDSPASERHLVAGDQVIEIEGRRIAGMTLEALQSLIRKPIGEALQLRLQPPIGDAYAVVLTASDVPDSR